jgi:hypothetical protein
MSVAGEVGGILASGDISRLQPATNSLSRTTAIGNANDLNEEERKKRERIKA